MQNSWLTCIKIIQQHPLSFCPFYIICINFNIIQTWHTLCYRKDKATFSPSERCAAPFYRECVRPAADTGGAASASDPVLYPKDFPLERFSENGRNFPFYAGNKGEGVSLLPWGTPAYSKGNTGTLPTPFSYTLSSFSCKDAERRTSLRFSPEGRFFCVATARVEHGLPYRIQARASPHFAVTHPCRKNFHGLMTL